MTRSANNRLRELRETSTPVVSREQLAIEFGVTAKTIERWEVGEIPTKALRRVAFRFRVSISHLLRDDEPAVA